MSTNSNSQKIGKMLQKRYILALSLIAFLVIFSQGMIQYTIMNQQDDSRIVNIAGRQRMLSQRINKAAFGLYISTEATSQKRYLDELTASLALWEKSHKGLQNGDTELGLPGKNSEKVVEMYKTIAVQHQKIVAAATTIKTLAATSNYDRTALLEQINIIQENESSFLKGMDAIVFQYDSESKQKIALIKLTEIIILIFTLFTLTMEILFIFRPAQKQIESSLEEVETNRDNLEKLFETAPSAMFLIDEANFQVTKLNHLAKEILGLSPEELLNVDIKSMLEPSQGNIKELMDRLISGVTIENLEVVLNTSENISLVMLLSSNVIKYDDKRTILMGLADITRLKEAEEVLKRYATVDEMTGLLNKRSGMLVLGNTFDHARKGGTELSVCFMDIDGLKIVNDTLGHEEGDCYIKTISQAIKQSTNSKDAIFRYGGDEIVIILNGCNRKNAETVISRIQNNLDKTAAEMAKPYHMHISHGIATLSETTTETPEALLTLADQEMYENKRNYKETNLV